MGTDANAVVDDRLRVRGNLVEGVKWSENGNGHTGTVRIDIEEHGFAILQGVAVLNYVRSLGQVRRGDHAHGKVREEQAHLAHLVAVVGGQDEDPGHV